MIVLDAGVLIALFDANDAHHAAAVRLFTEHLGTTFTLSPITMAEILVRAVSEGRDAQLQSDLQALGISPTPLPDDAPIRLARLRAETGTKMPDCCVLLTATQLGATVATFDQRLARIARTLRLTVLP